MNILIGDKYRITSDSCNVCIEEKAIAKNDTKNLKKGQEYWKPCNAYFPDLEQACVSLLNRQIRNSEAESIHVLKMEVIEATREIVEAVREYAHNHQRNTTQS